MLIPNMVVMGLKDVTKFFLEAGALKNISRSGWQVAGIKNPESVADHSFRTILIGYILAKSEGVDADKVMKMLVFHDLPEARIGDMHKVTANYIEKDHAEKAVAEDQAKFLPDNISKEYVALIGEFNDLKTSEAIVARDADWLEVAIQAKEYMDAGNKNVQSWIDRVRTVLKTESAKSILEEIEQSGQWWDGLKKKVE